MTNARDVWETYAGAWRAGDPAARRAQLLRSVAPHALYRDPLAECRGHDELVAYMQQFHEQVPGGHFVTNWFLAHHGRCIARWDMLDGAGSKLGEGVSYGEYGPDGALVAMTGFFEVPPLP